MGEIAIETGGREWPSRSVGEIEIEMEMEIEIVREWLEIESEIRVFLLVLFLLPRN